MEVVQLLLTADPAGARTVDNVRAPRCPLSTPYACSRAALPCPPFRQMHAMRPLLSAASRLAQAGRLPLHHAASCYAPAEVVQLLLEAHPEGAQATNDVSGPNLSPHPNGNLPGQDGNLTLTLALNLTLTLTCAGWQPAVALCRLGQRAS